MKSIKEIINKVHPGDEYIMKKIEDYLGNLDPADYKKYKGKIFFRIVSDIDRPEEDLSPITKFVCKECGILNEFYHKWKLGESAFSHTFKMKAKIVSCKKCNTDSLICYIQDNTVCKDRYIEYLKDTNLVFDDDFKFMFYNKDEHDE
ncbi:MAG: hypothetical protein QM489_04525 [Candidatus Izemoplasma sp.]